ncbi:MAG: S41 family peptidase [Fervidobacterium sp.]|uniref:C-terminal processing peptidase-3. Serine peptidase. MEROPS family S41A n=1 Tax=Fervidobacterium gondwanense DSM 13020 TaxID=1121883 RepID=A0A1M7RZP3_FERGO|nr:S41 family peptidase [Fervidobacterium gondwanense]SHN51562.1 C-terminal processing peptidase-3. Serine peptidase. MEROPS family S41A [Fervidobacterium gondwanense DSM 13020]
MKSVVKGIFSYVFVIAVVIGSSLILSGASDTQLLNYISPLYETLYRINYNYYDIKNVNFDKLIDSAIDGMVKGLGDDFSYYYPASQMNEQQIEMEGQYGGLGIEVTYDSENRAVKVVSPMYGTPAWRAGLQSGDLIIGIDDQPVSEMEYMEAVNKMRGKPGTSVKLTIKRGNEVIEVTIVREVIQIIPVKSGITTYNGKKIGYVLITKFNEPVPTELDKALRKIYDQKADALIIDLRNNPGGLLDVAIKVSNMFLDSGKVIVSVKDRDGKITDRYISQGNNYPKIPVVVLVNNGSASASEIVAAAIKENNRGVLIGEKTFGKGSVQRGFPLSNGGTVFLTIAHYITPSGKDIHKIGIEPNIKVTEIATSTSRKVEAKSYTLTEIEVDQQDPVIKTALDYLTQPGGK